MYPIQQRRLENVRDIVRRGMEQRRLRQLEQQQAEQSGQQPEQQVEQPAQQVEQYEQQVEPYVQQVEQYLPQVEQPEQQADLSLASVSQHAENGSSDGFQDELTTGYSATNQLHAHPHPASGNQTFLGPSQYPASIVDTTNFTSWPPGDYNTARNLVSNNDRYLILEGNVQNSGPDELAFDQPIERSYTDQRPVAATQNLHRPPPPPRPYSSDISQPYPSPHPKYTTTYDDWARPPSNPELTPIPGESMEALAERRRQYMPLGQEQGQAQPFYPSNPVEDHRRRYHHHHHHHPRCPQHPRHPRHQELSQNAPMPFYGGFFIPPTGSTNSPRSRNYSDTSANSATVSSYMAIGNNTEPPTVANEMSREVEAGPSHSLPHLSQGDGSASAPQSGNPAEYTYFRPFETYGGNSEGQAISRLEGILALDDARRRNLKRGRGDLETSSAESSLRALMPRTNHPARKRVDLERSSASSSIELTNAGPSYPEPSYPEPSYAEPSNAEPSNVGSSNAELSNAEPSNAGFSGPDVDLEAQTRPARRPPPDIPQFDGASGSRPAQPAQAIPLVPMGPIPNGQPQAPALAPPLAPPHVLRVDCGLCDAVDCPDCPEPCNPTCCDDCCFKLPCGRLHYGFRAFIIFFLTMLAISTGYIISKRSHYHPGDEPRI